MMSNTYLGEPKVKSGFLAPQMIEKAKEALNLTL